MDQILFFVATAFSRRQGTFHRLAAEALLCLGTGILFLLTAATASPVPHDRAEVAEPQRQSEVSRACGTLKATPELPKDGSALCRSRVQGSVSAVVRPLPRLSGCPAEPDARDLQNGRGFHAAVSSAPYGRDQEPYPPFRHRFRQELPVRAGPELFF